MSYVFKCIAEANADKMACQVVKVNGVIQEIVACLEMMVVSLCVEILGTVWRYYIYFMIICLSKSQIQSLGIMLGNY